MVDETWWWLSRAHLLQLALMMLLHIHSIEPLTGPCRLHGTSPDRGAKASRTCLKPVRNQSSYLLIKSVNHGLDPFHWFVGRHGRPGRRSQPRWQVQTMRPEPTTLFWHETVLWMDQKGRNHRILCSFCRIQHATAMTNHRKSSSVKLMAVDGSSYLKWKHTTSTRALHNFCFL